MSLTKQLIGLEGKRVEVTRPDGSKERFWVGVNSERAQIRIHIKLKTRYSPGGHGVGSWELEGATVRVVDHGPRLPLK